MKAVILAAGVGSRLAPLTNDRPKVLVEVAGRSFLFRQLDRLGQAGIPSADVVVVTGYKAEAVEAAIRRGGFACTLVFNDHFADWQNFYSLLVAKDALAGHDFLQLDGDVILDENLLPKVIDAAGDAVLAVDVRSDLDAETMKARVVGTRMTALDKNLDPATCAGEYIGITKLTARTAEAVFEDLARFEREGLTHEYYDHAYHRLSDRHAFEIVDVHDCKVIEIDDRADLERAEALLARA